MITFVTGNLLDDIGKTEAVVNTVNIVGVMGKGIALQFKNRFPENFNVYKKACEDKLLRIGKMLVYSTNQDSTKYIINFPTKTHWRYPSKLEYVEKGLDDLVKVLKEKKIKSIAIPALGCGNGNLSWSDVKPLIINKLEGLTEVNIRVYEPSQKQEKIEKETLKGKPRLTKERKLLLLLLETYNNSAPDHATHIEASQLTYLIQAFDNKLNMSFELKKYGPYSKSVNSVLQKLNGFYLSVHKKEGKATTIKVETTKFPKKGMILNDSILKKIKRLITGFESEDELMVLTVTHWFYEQKNIDSNELYDQLKKWCEINNHNLDDKLIKRSIDRIILVCSKNENLKLDL